MNGYETLIVSDEKKPSIIIEDYCDINLNKKYRNWINYIRPKGLGMIFIIDLEIIEKKLFQNVFKNAIYFYLFGDRFTRVVRDLKLLKSKGKKIIALFVGDDVKGGNLRWNKNSQCSI